MINLILLFLFFTNFNVESTSNNRDFYKILGVPRNASKDDIKKSYRELSKKYHPDMGKEGSSEKFLDIRDAHETLTNPELKKLYDAYGEKGLDPNFRPGSAQPCGFPGGPPCHEPGFDGSNFFFFTNEDNDSFKNFFDAAFPFGRKQKFHEDIYYDNQPNSMHIVTLSKLTWDNYLNKCSGDLLVYFFSYTSSKCKNFNQIFLNLAELLNSSISFAQIDCNQNRTICLNYNISHVPSLMLFREKKTKPLLYKSEMSELTIKKWLSHILSENIYELTSSNLESWLVSDPDQEKLIFFRDAILVPFWFIIIHKSFYKKISMATVNISSIKGKSFYENSFKKNNKANSPSKFPCLFRLENIDTLYGDFFCNNLENENLLSLIISRILITKVLSKSSFWRTDHKVIPELTRRRYQRGESTQKDHNKIFLLLWNGYQLNLHLQNVLIKYANLYIQSSFKLFWVNAKSQIHFVSQFNYFPDATLNCDLHEITIECFRFLIYNPKRFVYLSMPIENISSLDYSIQHFIDSVVNFGKTLSTRIDKKLNPRIV